jgi:hypothetical protein
MLKIFRSYTKNIQSEYSVSLITGTKVYFLIPREFSHG